jgi:hypothetical protein
MNKQTPHPCSGCARHVAYRHKVQRLGGGGKGRVRHKCQHGEWCVFGEMQGHMGHNWPQCPECLVARKAETPQQEGRREDG